MYVVVSQTMNSLDQNIKRADSEGFEVLGAPIGTETHNAKILSKRVEKIELLSNRLQQFDDPHAAYGILKICIGTPKLLYSLAKLSQAPQLLKSRLFWQCTYFEGLLKNISQGKR